MAGTVRLFTYPPQNALQSPPYRTDWPKANSLTGRKLEASIREDVDDIVGELDWTKAVKGIPAPNDHINIRTDIDVKTEPVLNEK